MAFPMAAAIGAGASLLGGMMGNSSSAEQARKARHSAELMFATQYQIHRKDLIRAGMNPMLAYMHSAGGTPTPHGATMQNPAAGAGQIISEAMTRKATVENLETNSAKNVADANKSNAEAGLASALTGETNARTPTHAANIGHTQAQTEAIKIGLPNIMENHRLTTAQTQKVYTEITQLTKQGNLTEAHTKEALARTGLTNAQVSKILPEINHLIAQTNNLKAILPLDEAKGSLGEALNLPKIINNSAKATHDPESFGAKLYDFLHPSTDARNARRDKSRLPKPKRSKYYD